MLRHPVRHLWRKWNDKAAITSATVRGALFFAVNSTAGLSAAQSALATEFALRFVTSGFYGALTQAFSTVVPARTGWLAAIVILPAIAHTLELAVHWVRGTPQLAASIAVSVALTALSTSFNVFAMRRGVLTVGSAGSRSLLADLRELPGVIVSFVREHLPPRRWPPGAGPRRSMRW